MNINAVLWKRVGATTAVAGTPIVIPLHPLASSLRQVVTRLVALTAATAQVLTVMQVKKKHIVAVGAASGQKVITLPASHGVVANDYLGFILENGAFYVDKVASVSTNAITMTVNLAAALLAGATVYDFQAPADGHEQIDLPISAQTTLESESGVTGADKQGDPIVLYIANVTNACTVQSVIAPLITI